MNKKDIIYKLNQRICLYEFSVANHKIFMNQYKLNNNNHAKRLLKEWQEEILFLSDLKDMIVQIEESK